MGAGWWWTLHLIFFFHTWSWGTTCSVAGSFFVIPTIWGWRAERRLVCSTGGNFVPGSKKWKTKGRKLPSCCSPGLSCVCYVQSRNKSLSLFGELWWGLYLLDRNWGSEILTSTLRMLFAVERDNSADLCIGKTRIKAWSALHSKSSLLMTSFRNVWKVSVANYKS